jgi:large subunit ribosomal protein L29
MSLPQFNEINGLSNVEISDAIIKAGQELFNLKFKKATRQPFKSHEIKFTKRRLAQLKTVLTLRLNALEQTNNNAIVNLIQKQNYLTNNF